jgi:hypothetical protein
MITQRERDLLYFETRAVAYDLAARDYAKCSHVNSEPAHDCRESAAEWAGIAGQVRRAMEVPR